MNLVLYLGWILTAQTAAEAPAATRSQTAGVVSRVEVTLENDPQLLECHRGYLGFLEKSPALRDAEEAWQELNVLTEIRPLVRDFDEAMHKDVRAQTLFDQYYDQLARDETLRASVDALQRAEFARGKIRSLTRAPARGHPLLPGDVFGEGMVYLRANPDTAIRFLQNPQAVKPVPDALYPLLGHFEDRPELLKELLDAFQGLTGSPQAYARVFPWWNETPPFDLRSAGAYGRLYAALKAHPSRFWIWHHDNLALAADAQARSWIRYWFRKVRRTPGLAEDYAAYLQHLRKRPETAEQTQQRWNQQYGPAPEWPPKTAPPPLPAFVPAESIRAPGGERIQKPTYTRPDKPNVSRPKMPDKPTMPRKPVIERPVIPNRPAKEVRTSP